MEKSNIWFAVLCIAGIMAFVDICRWFEANTPVITTFNEVKHEVTFTYKDGHKKVMKYKPEDRIHNLD